MDINNYLLLNMMVLVIYLYSFKVRKSIIKVDHCFLLVAGIIFYWLMPIYAYENKLFTYSFNELYQEISHSNIEDYLIYVLIIITSFLIGDGISNKLSIKFSKNNYCYSNYVLDAFYWVFLLLTLYSAYSLRESFFTGYENVSAWPHERGWFISCCMALITLNVINSFNIIYKKQVPVNKLKYLLVFNKYFVSALFFNFLMLSTGNRGYFISFLITILLIFNEVKGGFKLTKIIYLTLAFSFFNGFIAVLRSKADLNFMSTVGNIFYESVNVGVTLFHHIRDMNYNLIEFPDVLISKFIGIIPSIIFPGKFALMISPADVGKTVIRYQATTHNYVELLINFGLIGTIFIFFVLGVTLNWLKSKKHYVAIYVAVSAQIPFFFFRSFYDATVKYIFEFSILLPIVILSISLLRKKYLISKS